MKLGQSVRELDPRFRGQDLEGNEMKGRVLNSSIMASVTAVVVVLWVMLASVPKTSAIPAFSRKYQTSCTTCHNNYPELNDFGEAFKKNGFKFPKDDEVFVKEPPVLLGSKAQKEAFPGAVYPGEIPGIPADCVPVRGEFYCQSQAASGCHRAERIRAADGPFCSKHLHDHQCGELRAEPLVLD